jgi:hypothetical protein
MSFQEIISSLSVFSLHEEAASDHLFASSDFYYEQKLRSHELMEIE